MLRETVVKLHPLVMEPLTPSKLGRAVDCYHWLMPLFAAENDDRERFAVVALDNLLRPVAFTWLTEGSLNHALVHPRDVFRWALLNSPAAGVIVAHNHPGGNPAPSDEDRALTRRLVLAGEALGVAVLDHVILGDGCYYSFSEAGKL